MNQHWSVDTREIEKDTDALIIWNLEQRINWGIGKDKINREELLKYWDKIDIDVFRRKALALALF